MYLCSLVKGPMHVPTPVGLIDLRLFVGVASVSVLGLSDELGLAKLASP